VGETVDRSGLVALASPVVLPASVVAALPEWPDLTDLPALVASLADRFEVCFVEAPAEGRRIVDESDLRLLAASGA
jgi:2-C-methyl-D-erythritol 4-phosphate cytidylyltransferase